LLGKVHSTFGSKPAARQVPHWRSHRRKHLTLAISLALAFGGSLASSATSAAEAAPSVACANCADLSPRAQSEAPALHLEAIQFARQNQFEPALARLRLLAQTYPADSAYATDYAVVLAWSGRDSEALDQFSRLRSAPPAYANETLAKSARNLRRYDTARELYQAALRADPRNLQAHTGLFFTLADAGQLDAALTAANHCVTAFATQRDAHAARAYVHEKKGAWVDALSDYERMLALDPSNRAAKRARALIAARLGAQQLALEHANAQPEAFSAAELRRMRGDVSATLIRWGEMRDARDPERFKETDAALQRLSPQAIAQLSGDEALRARFDRLLALRDRVRMQDVVNDYRKLQQEKVELPPYAATAVADALLYLELPDEARELYARSLRADPNNSELTCVVLRASRHRRFPQRTAHHRQAPRKIAELAQARWFPRAGRQLGQARNRTSGGVRARLYRNV
jgi:biofilm PGA synthesis protein PgaA